MGVHKSGASPQRGLQARGRALGRRLPAGAGRGVPEARSAAAAPELLHGAAPSPRPATAGAAAAYALHSGLPSFASLHQARHGGTAKESSQVPAAFAPSQ